MRAFVTSQFIYYLYYECAIVKRNKMKITKTNNKNNMNNNKMRTTK